jgi:hypothetical protein
MSLQPFQCRCRCGQSVDALQVADTVEYNCMIYRIAEHALPGGTRCAGSGMFINLHPGGLEAFRGVLMKLWKRRPELFNRRGDIDILLVATTRLSAVA